MNKLITLESWLRSAPNTNTIEISIINPIKDKDKESIATTMSGIIDISNPKLPSHINLSMFGNTTPCRFTNYYHKDLVYTYNMLNDGQRVYKRTLLLDELSNLDQRIYVACYYEDNLASHRFPTSDNINNKNIIDRNSYRINNRIFLIHDTVYEENNKIGGNEYIYLRYNHSYNVEIDKMQHDIERVVRLLITPTSKTNASQ